MGQKYSRILDHMLIVEKTMGADKLPPASWESGFQWDPLQLKTLETIGIEVTPDEIDLEEGTPLTYRGKRVVLYIKDVRVHGHHLSLPKFHVTFCRTLADQQSRQRFNSRYVVTRNTSGSFVIRINGGPEHEEHLSVCKNCLTTLNYKGFRSLAKSERDNFVSKFSIAEYFENGYLNSAPQPLHLAVSAPVSEYTSDWPAISRRMKEMHNYQCQSCHLRLLKFPQFVDTHHKDANRANNVPNNLKVLCVRCHAEQPLHEHLKNTKRYKQFLQSFPLKR